MRQADIRRPTWDELFGVRKDRHRSRALTITAITPTGDRPLAFALCQLWMARQRFQPAQWIVVDDGWKASSPFADCEYVRRIPSVMDPKITLALNLRTAMSRVRGEGIIIIEDDEYYGPGYIETMAKKMETYDIVGICRSKYYHLPSGGHYVHGNTRHASLAETAFRSEFMDPFMQVLNEKETTFIDTRLWQRARGSWRRNLFIDAKEPLYLGIKGLEGRGGIGIGHEKWRYETFDGQARETLKEWVPKDYEIYLDIIAGRLTAENAESYIRERK